MKNITKLKIPERFCKVNYETDVPEFIKEYVNKIEETKKGLYFFGPAGTGKTHIAYAICKKLEEDGIRVRAFNSTDILRMIKEDMNFSNNKNYKTNGERYFEEGEDFLTGINNFKGLLFIDDFGTEKSTEWAIEVFNSIINKKYEDLIPVIFTSNSDLDLLGSKTGDRIASRIGQMCDVIAMAGEDKRIGIIN